MQGFVPKANLPQKQATPSATKSGSAPPRHEHREDPAPEPPQTIAEQMPRRSAPGNPEPPEDGSARTSAPGLRWNFSRIPVHPPSPAVVQTKLAINRPRDEYEREADCVAAKVLSMPSAAKTPLMAAGGAPRREHMQRKAAGPSIPGPAQAPPIVQKVLRAPGQPLDAATRAFMEPRFGLDFSSIRVHSGVEAGQSAREIAAKAYTVGNNIVFGPNRLAPGTQEGRRLIAHELAHVVQQSAPSPDATLRWGGPASDAVPSSIAARLSHLPSGMIQRDGDTEPPNPWDKLSTPIRKQAEDLWEECDDSIGALDEAQMTHSSPTRDSWIGFLRRVRTRIEALDNDTNLKGVKNSYNDFETKIGGVIDKARNEWLEVKQHYLNEHHWLVSPRAPSADSIEAAKYLENIYRNTENRVPFLATEDDYAELKRALDTQEYIRIGALRGTRIRAKQLLEMMRTVADLKRKGEDANKFIPEWSERVLEEAAYIASFAKLAKEAGRDYAKEMADLRDQLRERQAETAKVGPPEKSWFEKGADLVKGGVEAIAGIFVEAAKEAVDLAQIVLHFETLGKYEPKFISDMAKAADEGATTGDLFKGMVMGVIDTPSRFLQACRDGDWEAIGKETVNLYMLAKTVKEAPETIKKIKGAVEKLPELLAKTQESLGILRQRTVALGLKNESRFVPEPAPKPVNPPAAQAPPPPKPAPVPPPPDPVPAPAPAPAPTIKQGGGQGSGKPTGMLRSTDSASKGVKVDASHPVLKNKVPANDPPPHSQGQVVKKVANAPKDVLPAQHIDPAPTSAPSNQGADRPRATAGDPPKPKPPATVPSPSKVVTPTPGATKTRQRVTQVKPPKPAPGQAPLDVPLTEDERGLTADQLRRKHMREDLEKRQSDAHDDLTKDTEKVKKGHKTGKAGAGMAATPKHHVFPQTRRPWFESHGFTGDHDIDHYTVEIPEAGHQAIHGGGNYRLGRTTGFDWNSQVMAELDAAENALQGSRLLTRDEVFAIVLRLMREYDISQHFVPYE